MVVLIDARHEVSKLDLQMLYWLNDNNIPPVVVATKADKLSTNHLNSKLQHNLKILKKFGVDNILPFSAITGMGKKHVIQEISNYLNA